jgi:hypothetical protein
MTTTKRRRLLAVSLTHTGLDRLIKLIYLQDRLRIRGFGLGDRPDQYEKAPLSQEAGKTEPFREARRQIG